MDITIEVNFEDDDSDRGAVARALGDIVAEQDGAVRTKVYLHDELVHEVNYDPGEDAKGPRRTAIFNDPTHTWNYRVIEGDQGHLAIHEVHYADDVPVGWSVDPVAPCGDSLAELADDLGAMLVAVHAPVLILSDLKAMAGIADTPAASSQTTDQPGDYERHVDLGDGDSLTIKITHEGVIFDAIHDGQIIGTTGMTFGEWFEGLR